MFFCNTLAFSDKKVYNKNIFIQYRMKEVIQ